MSGFSRLAFRPPSTHEIDDQADYQNQAKPAAADHGTTKVKAAAAKQENKEKDQEYRIHACKLA
jgi:hypothetical protein